MLIQPPMDWIGGAVTLQRLIPQVRSVRHVPHFLPVITAELSLTLGTLRAQIAPVSPAQFMEWLLHWQHMPPGTQAHGECSLLEILRQLQRFEIPANSWEKQILARRVAGYDPQLLQVFRRMEDCGEVRGGRFVDGFLGEQYGQPVAVDSLREMRNRVPSGEIVPLSTADPLNLMGIVIPGARVPALAKQQILLRDGAFAGSAHVTESDRTRVQPITQKQTPLRTVKKYW